MAGTSASKPFSSLSPQKKIIKTTTACDLGTGSHDWGMGSHDLGVKAKARGSQKGGQERGQRAIVGRNFVKRQISSLRGQVSSSSGSKEPLQRRLGVRPGDKDDASIGWSGGCTSWSEVVSTSGSSGSHVTSRLGARQEMSTSRKLHPTMIADSASSPTPKVASRLGTHKSKAFASSISSNSRASKSKTLSSMVADEYELQRQLDIRSRLARKEQEVWERRSGPLRGRLGQHQVFERLT